MAKFIDSHKLLQGTCGWSDASLVACGRFYPKGCRTAAERLAIYSKTFQCVEVDTSCYAIPSTKHVAQWVGAVPAAFKFHFKAFGLFCSGGCNVSSLPWAAKQALPEHLLSKNGYLQLQHMPAEVEQICWERFNECLEPVVSAGKMGLAVFQFHTSFAPTEANRARVERCRENLAQGVAMAVEFRNRAWFAAPQAAAALEGWLRRLGVVLIAADELKHETLTGDAAAGASLGSAAPEVLPIALLVTSPAAFYVRLHRREGTKERILGGQEIEAWARRLEALPSTLTGPIYFMWGTDWEDAPIVNASALLAVVPAALRPHWEAYLGLRKRSQPLLASFSSWAQPGGAKAAKSPAADSATPSSSAPRGGPGASTSLHCASRPGRDGCQSPPQTDARRGELGAVELSGSEGGRQRSSAAQPRPVEASEPRACVAASESAGSCPQQAPPSDAADAVHAGPSRDGLPSAIADGPLQQSAVAVAAGAQSPSVIRDPPSTGPHVTPAGIKVVDVQTASRPAARPVDNLRGAKRPQTGAAQRSAVKSRKSVPAKDKNQASLHKFFGT